jgi:2-C-methyl-D-erythritol 2,4-cyclodiphosphate synthase
VRIGSGFDVHAFGPGDFVMLGGVRVPHVAGVVAHSDGDVVLHAVCDALLGAAGLGDIGQHFSDKDPQWRGADSAQFVTAVLKLLDELLAVRPENVNIKATTTERLGFLGRAEGIAAQAVVLLIDDARPPNLPALDP